MIGPSACSGELASQSDNRPADPREVDRRADVLLRVRGVVQGVGFRPFVQRTAAALGMRGWVRNDADGVLVRAAGTESNITALVRELRDGAPSAARVNEVVVDIPSESTPPVGAEFTIVSSHCEAGRIETAAPPDLALCESCRRELSDPGDRRHRYPFINCTQCGPRYSILESLPYDRPRTSMRAFRMCPACEAEYRDPGNRRFHAQPNACEACGPGPALVDSSGSELARGDDAILAAAGMLKGGRIVAVKGIGGYHLLVDATNEASVARLRQRKVRDEKPFAVMFSGIDAARSVADVSESAAALLRSSAAPIVLLRRRRKGGLASNVAPSNPWVGVLLAYTPLHVLLLQCVEFPVVATSGNLSEEPLCIEPGEAHARLAGIADCFLDHNRPILHPVDDSVLRLGVNGPVFIRRARGYAPTSLPLRRSVAGSVLCVGAQMKCTVATAQGRQVAISPHIGDLSGASTLPVFRRTIETLASLHQTRFTHVACDKHPGYESTRHAVALGLPTIPVQHHLAHVLACLLENRQSPDGVLGVAWDGTGFGEDGTVWGGEFILLEGGKAFRFASVRPFRLLGAEAAVREPRRVALSLLHQLDAAGFGEAARAFGFDDHESSNLLTMLARGIRSPIATSAGRLFDAVGALLGIGTVNHFEGQTALAVETAAISAPVAEPRAEIAVRPGAGSSHAAWELDWRPLIARMAEAKRNGAPPAGLAMAFHRSLADAIVAVARRSRVTKVALSGGCFQNLLLLELASAALREAGFGVLTHRELPPNDGSISVGQAAAASWDLTTVALP